MDRLEAWSKLWSGPFALIPGHLPRSDFEMLGAAKISESMRLPG